jgi:hypothetical protein
MKMSLVVPTVIVVWSFSEFHIAFITPPDPNNPNAATACVAGSSVAAPNPTPATPAAPNSLLTQLLLEKSSQDLRIPRPFDEKQKAFRTSLLMSSSKLLSFSISND